MAKYRVGTIQGCIYEPEIIAQKKVLFFWVDVYSFWSEASALEWITKKRSQGHKVENHL